MHLVGQGRERNGGIASQKLRIQPGQRILIANAPAGYAESLGELPEGVEVSAVPEGKFDFVHLFVQDSGEFARLGPPAIEAVKYDGLLWLSYPKQSSRVDTDLTRDVMWELMADTGLRPVTQVSIDPVWSALRFRASDEVGKIGYGLTDARQSGGEAQRAHVVRPQREEPRALEQVMYTEHLGIAALWETGEPTPHSSTDGRQ